MSITINWNCNYDTIRYDRRD